MGESTHVRSDLHGSAPPILASFTKASEALIAKVFGQNPVQCPRCHQDMKLKGFLLKTSLMFKEIQVLSRAPPPKTFPRYRDLPDQGSIDWEDITGTQGNPNSPLMAISDWKEEDFDQTVNC